MKTRRGCFVFFIDIYSLVKHIEKLTLLATAARSNLRCSYRRSGKTCFQCIDVSSPQPQTADRDHSQGERESGSGTANQSRVNSPAGQWEPGGEDVSLMLNPPPPIESCLEGPRGGVAGRGEGGEGAGRTGQEKPVQGKTL